MIEERGDCMPLSYHTNAHLFFRFVTLFTKPRPPFADFGIPRIRWIDTRKKMITTTTLVALTNRLRITKCTTTTTILHHNLFLTATLFLRFGSGILNYNQFLLICFSFAF